MPSQAMRDVTGVLRERRKASAGQAPLARDERRAAFAPARITSPPAMLRQLAVTPLTEHAQPPLAGIHER